MRAAEQTSANSRSPTLRQLLYNIFDRFGGYWQGPYRCPEAIRQGTISAAGQRAEPTCDEGRSSAEIAWQLLVDHLSPEQRREMDVKLGFTVMGGKTGVRYVIAQGRISNVHVLNKQGHVIAKLCFGPAASQDRDFREELPDGDIMLAQKIALEDAELEPQALRVANIRFSHSLRAYPELKAIGDAIRSLRGRLI
jgi:hypothetical protein